MGTDEKYGGHLGAHGLMPRPGDPRYVSVEEATRRQLAFNIAHEARPEVIARRALERQAAANRQAERDAARKRPRFVPTTDYPWLKPDWVEPPVRPFKR